MPDARAGKEDIEYKMRHHSGIELISPDRFLVNRRFSDVKLLRLDNRLLEASEKLLMAVSGRLEAAEDSAERGSWLKGGDMAPYRPEIDPLGVLRVLLGKSPNCAVGERVSPLVGEATDAPDTEE
jgi:hypothetical protein